MKAQAKIVTDPVCGMQVAEEKTQFFTDTNGTRIFFCSFSCQSEFERNPAKYSISRGTLKVGDIMTAEVQTASPEASVLEAAKKMVREGHGCLVVQEGGRVVGMVTERDLVSKVLAEDISPSKLRVKDVMSSALVVATSDAAVEDASKTMSQYHVRRLLVVDEGELVGIITATDIALRLARENEFRDQRLNAVARYCVSPAPQPYG